MGDMNDPFSKSSRMRATGKGTAWSSWNIPEGMTESEALTRREKAKKSYRRFKHHDPEQMSRLPFEEMFLFGSHPESDILSISQCPGCSRRYKTQWLHNYHWEQNSSGDYVCALSKTVVIPHRSSSKSDHHKHHHQDSGKLSDGLHMHAHSKSNNISSGKVHHGSSPASNGSSNAMKTEVFAKIDGIKSSSSKSDKKLPLMTKAKAKMMPPNLSAEVTVPVATAAVAVGSASPRSSSAASYTLSIPSDDTAQDESVESLLRQVEFAQAGSNNNYTNGSSSSNGKSVQMIATAVQKTSKPVENEYEQMKFYSAEPQDIKSSSKPGNYANHQHGQKLVFGNENDVHTVLAEGVAGGDGAKFAAAKAGTQSVAGTTLQNFKIPLKSKSHESKLSYTMATSPVSSPHSNSQNSSVSSSKHKSKLSPSPSSSSSSSKSSSQDCPSPFSPHSHRVSGTVGSPLSATAHSPLPVLYNQTTAGSASSPQPLSSAISPGGLNAGDSLSPSHKVVGAFPADSPLKVESKNLDSSPPPPKKKKKKKSKNEPRKILPLKDRQFDPDIHCGVINPDTGEQCTRSLTCKTHSMASRRAVVGRSQNFDQLLAEHKKARDAERAAKIASEQQPGEISAAGFGASNALGANSTAVSQQQQQSPTVSKGKAKSPYGAHSPSPLSSSSITNTNPKSASSTITSGSSSPLIASYSTPRETSFFLQKLETDVSKSSGLTNLESAQQNRKSNELFDNDFLSASSLGIYESGAGNGSIPKVLSSSVNSDSTGVSTAYSMGNDFGDASVEIPSDVILDRAYHATKNSENSSVRGGNFGFSSHCDTEEPMEVQDPLAVALEMAAASAMGNAIPEPSPSYSTSADHTSNLGYSSASQSMFPASSSVVASPSYSTSVYPSNNYNVSSTYSPTPSYSLTTANYPSLVSSSYPSNEYHGTGFAQQTVGDFHKEGYPATARGYQVPGFPAAGYRGFGPSPSSHPASSPTRYANSTAYPKTPSMYPPTAVYPSGSSVYPTPGMYPGGTPMYQPASSSLFPSEPPVFSILDDLFSENPAPSNEPPIPPDPNITTPGSPFRQPFLLRGTISGTSSLESSLNSKYDPSRQWHTIGEGALSAGDADQPLGATNFNGSNNGRRRSESQINRLKKLLAVREKANECENNAADYLALTGSENIERGFIYIQRQKDPLLKTDETKVENSKHPEDIENMEERNQEDIENKAKKKSSKKKKRSIVSPYVPFVVKRLKEDENTQTKLELEKEKAEPKIPAIPSVTESKNSEETDNFTPDPKAEAVKTIQSSLMALNALSEPGNKQKPEALKESGKADCNRQSISKLLSGLADLSDISPDFFNGMKRLRMKDILRHFSTNTSLNGEIKDDGEQNRSTCRPDTPVDVQGNWPCDDGEHHSVFSEIESYIDAIPVLEVEP